MRFFIDHNLSPTLTGTIAALHSDHEYLCAHKEGLGAMDDIPLFADWWIAASTR